ncbi:MAG: TM2 domain-containing protein [Candidatus Dadabacteria bacterium]
MDSQQMMMMMPGLQPEELVVLQTVTKEMNEEQKQQFFALYQGKRKDQQTLLILTLIGFFGIAGIQRFVVGDTVLGIVYLFTLGFCGIGTIIDLVNIKSMASDFNQKQAIETANMVLVMNKM